MTPGLCGFSAIIDVACHRERDRDVRWVWRAPVAVAASCIVALAGCESMQKAGSQIVGSGPNIEAKLVAIGGAAVTGAAILRAYDGGVMMTVNFNGPRPGAYRVVVHANGNCSSPNGFSAGPPWAPPGVAVVRLPLVKNDDAASFTVRLPGYRFDGPDGVLGRSVVVHAGATGSLEAEPGVPNNRIACGVISTARSLFAPTN